MDPLTICPPFAKTYLPEVEVAKSNPTLLLSNILIFSGIRTSLSVLNTVIIKLVESNSCDAVRLV